MATTAPPVSAQQPPPPTDGSPSTQLSWEGDKMFNIYIYDYCYKRGFRKTAQELLIEAEIPPESTPPINARQGLLFEWWSVFWVLFTAKANGTGTEDAMLYTQHQGQQAASRQAPQRLQGPPTHPLGQAPQTPMQTPQQQPQGPPMGRLPNGVPRQPPYVTNGPMANGVGPGGMPPGNMAPGPPTAFSVGGPSPPQPNGIAGPSAPPANQGPPMSHQNSQQLFSNQRPPIGGPPQRGPNGVPPFPSPTLSHSPQNPGGPSGQPQMQQLSQQQMSQQLQGPPQHSQAPMGQLGPSTPGLAHMNRNMLPPQGGPPGMNPMMLPGGQQQQQQHQPGGTPTQSYQQVGRPPSRTATPGQNGGMSQPSPSLQNRQLPEQMMNQEIMSLPAATLGALMQESGLGNKDMSALTIADKNRILSLHRQRTMGRKPGDSAAPGPSNMMQPPNQQRNPHQLQQQTSQPQQQQNQQQQGPQRIKRNSTSPGEEHETLPRNESSPPERKRARRSPMENPPQGPLNIAFGHPGQQQPGPGGPGPGQQPQQQQKPGPPGPMGLGPGPAQNIMMMRGPMGGMPNPMNGVPSQQHQQMQGPGPQMGMNLGLGGPMGMNPGHPGASVGMLNQQMHMQQQQQQREAQYRHTLHTLHKNTMPQTGLGQMGGNVGSPASDPSFNPGMPPAGGQGPQFNPGMPPANRMAITANKGLVMMPPPPSPAMGNNGPPKDGNGLGGKDGNKGPDGSPRNGPPGSGPGQGPNNGGPSGLTGPPTPGPPGQGQPGQGISPSPSNILGGPNSGQGPGPQQPPPPGMGQPPPQQPQQNQQQQQVSAPPSGPPSSVSVGGDPVGAQLFTSDFINTIASSLDDFDTTMFRPDGDINFERDFGQWFNPDDVGGGLDAK